METYAAGGNLTLPMIAYKGNTVQLTAFLKEQKPDLTLADDDGRTPLHWSAAGGNLPMLQALLQIDAVKKKCLDAGDESGYTPLMSATACGGQSSVEFLIQSGADPNKKNEQGCIALHYHKGRAALVELLAPRTRDINASDCTGVTPLHRAAGPGYIDATRALLAAGAKVNATDAEGYTPLHYACEEGRAEVVFLLVDHGADITLKTKEGKACPELIPRSDEKARISLLAALRHAT